MLKLPEIRVNVFQQGLILVGVPLLIELLLIGTLSMLLLHADRERTRENRYRQLSALGARLITLTYDAPYMIFTSLQVSDPKLIAAYKSDIVQIRSLSRQTIALSANDPIIENATRDLDESLETYLSLMAPIAEARSKGSALNLLAEIPAIQAHFNSSKNVAMERIATMVRIGQRSVQESEKRIIEVRFLQGAILSLGLIANLVFGVLLLYFYRRRIMQRLSVIMNNTILLSENKQLSNPLGGYDEIARLDLAFHSMAAQLLESQEKERALFNNASDVICVLDAGSKFVKINTACERLWYYRPESMLERGLFDLLPDSDVEKARQSLRLSKASNEPSAFELKIKGGNQSLIETLWSTYWSESESLLYCVVHDISERKNTERVKQHFLSLISSDLRRPLSSISRSVSDLLQKGTCELPALAHEKLVIAEKNVLRLLGLVNDLLQMAELDSGKLQIHKQICNTGDLLKRSVQDVEAVALKQGVQIELIASPENWLVDPDRIMQVLVNLLSNAIKFSPPASIVTLCAGREGTNIIVKVQDCGRGIPAEYRQTVFEKFKQVKTADGKRKSGTGLGLPICKQIIEEHGGRIGVESEEGKGSTFWFAVPSGETTDTSETACPDMPEQIQDQDAGGYLPAAANKTSNLSPHSTDKTQEITEDNQKKTNTPSKLSLRLKNIGRFKLSQKGLLLIGIPILFEFSFAAAISVQLTQTDAYRQSELKQRMLATHASRLLQQYLKSAFLLTSPRNQDNWLAFTQCYQDMLKLRHDLKVMTANDRQTHNHYLKVEEYNYKADEFFQHVFAVMGSQYSLQRHGQAYSDRDRILPLAVGVARRLQTIIHDAEKREFNPVQQAQQRSAQAGLLLSGLSTNFFLSLLLVLYFSKDMSSRLATLSDNAARLAREQQLNEELGGSDEIAQIDRAFHRSAKLLDAARRKERAVFDNSRDLICACNTEGRFISSNPACFKMLGYTREEFLQKSIIDITLPEDKDRTEKVLLSHYEPAVHKTLENRVIRRDNTHMYLLWSASKDAEEKSIYAVAHDISSRKELEQLKQEFLAVVSHDLRTPLTSIAGIAKLVLAGAFGQTEDSARVLLQDITREGDNLLELINDLLDIEKLEAGQMQLSLEPVNLSDILEKARESAAAAQKNVIELPLLSGRQTIQADRDRIIQACSNIFSYALSSRQDGAPIQVSTAATSDTLEIAVEVPGLPLSEAACAGIFDRFSAVNVGTTSGTHQGGLQMPIARRIIESHGGSIGVRANDDRTASIYWLRLPKSKPDSAGSHPVK